GGQDKYGGGAVKDVAGGELPPARGEDRRLGGFARPDVENRENRAHRAVDFEVGRAVERIEDKREPGLGIGPRNGRNRFQLLGDEDAKDLCSLGFLDEDLVGENVERLLLLAL